MGMIAGSCRVSLLSGRTCLMGWIWLRYVGARPRIAGPRRWPSGPRRPRARGEAGWAAPNSNKKMFLFFKTIL
jgi:hypothetical protein